MKRSNFLKLGFLLLAIPLSMWNCKKEEIVTNDNNLTSLFENVKYNNDYKELSIIISKALKDNINFRNLIKNEALKMFDGDYDILLKDFKSVSFDDNQTKITVGEFLNNYANNILNSSASRTSNDLINQLVSEYPLLQISIPVHADEWDTEYVPKVAFIPYEYDESDTFVVAGYDGENEIEIDAVNIPSNPVVVISSNERVDNNGRLLSNIVTTPSAPSVSISLSGMTTESGIRLNWTVGLNTGDPIIGYRIYRKQAGQPTFTAIGTSAGAFNLTYDDTNVVSNVSYSYRVVAFSFSSESSPSNIINITAPIRPESVVTFDVEQLAINDVEARWTNDNTSYFEETLLYKRTIGVDNDYNLINSFDPNTHYYIDNSIIPGKKTIYKVNQSAPLGVSNPKFDFIKAPYRDISSLSPVYVEKIQFDDWSIEGWLAGKPEFKLSVASVNTTSNDSYLIQENVIFKFCMRMNHASFNNKLMLNWQPGLWYEMLTFKLVEYDVPHAQIDFNFSAKAKKKNFEKTGFDVDLGVNAKVQIENHSEDCGSAYYTYYEEGEKWLYFPNYGARIKVSTVDTLEACFN